jgi:hypothetical protein
MRQGEGTIARRRTGGGNVRARGADGWPGLSTVVDKMALRIITVLLGSALLAGCATDPEINAVQAPAP